MMQFKAEVEKFNESQLKSYLALLDKTGHIEDDSDSDDKARVIVAAWKRGKGGYNLTPKLKTLLIKEMQSGFTGDEDEQAILDILERSNNSDLSQMFTAGGLSAEDVLSDFHGDEEDRLLKFYDERFEGGAKKALKGSTLLKPRAESFGKEQVEVRSAKEAAEARRIIADIKDKYGVDISSEKGIEGIKKEYTSVPKTELDKLKTRAWKMEELRAVERALAHYAPILGAERGKSTRAKPGQEVTSIGKVEQAIDVDQPTGKLDTTTLGEFFGKEKNFSLFKAIEGKSHNFPGQPEKQLEGTTTHEIAHGLLEYRVPAFVSKFKYWKSRYKADADATTRVANKSVEAPITFYGGTSADEDLSESAKFYFVEPATLKDGDKSKGPPAKGTPGNPCPERFKFMEDTVKGWTPPPKKGKKKP